MTTERQITPSFAAEIKDAAERKATHACIALAVDTMTDHADPMVRTLAGMIKDWAMPLIAGAPGDFEPNTVERHEVPLRRGLTFGGSLCDVPLAGMSSPAMRVWEIDGWSVTVDVRVRNMPTFSVTHPDGRPLEEQRPKGEPVRITVYPGTVIRFGLHEIVLLAPVSE